MKARTGAFTLIEMLVVIAIIVILATLILPAVNKARMASTRAKAGVAVSDLRTALVAYYDEYKRWPTGLTGNDNGTDIEVTTTGIEVEPNVARMLSGEDVNDQNPRRVPFLDMKGILQDENGDWLAYTDPWGKPYKYMCDYDLDDVTHIRFENSGETNLPVTVAVWSRGRNGTDQAGRQNDDVRSW